MNDCQPKPVYASKINWIGACLTLCGLITDPEVVRMLGDLIPPTVLPRVLSIGGLLTIVLRTLFTSQPILDKR